MASQTDIVNGVISGLLGQEPVEDLSEASLAGSNAAVKLLRVYDQAYLALLDRHGWLCALNYTTLAPAVDQSYANYKYTQAFDLPADCIRVWSVGAQACAGSIGFPYWWGRDDLGLLWGERVMWEFGTRDTDVGARKIIRASLQSLDVAYVRKCEEAALTPSMVDALVYDLAARACKSITGDSGEGWAKQAAQKLVFALGSEAQEGGQETLAHSPINAVRAWGRF